MSSQGLSKSGDAQAAGRRFANLNLWHVSLVLVAIGLIISGYLSYVKLTNVEMACAAGSVFNCDVVQNSSYSRMFNIPIAWLGLATYIVIGVLLLIQNRVAFLREYGMLLLFGLVLFGWVYSMYLVYVQFFVLKALCMWCLMHEINFTILFIVTALRLRNFLAIES